MINCDAQPNRDCKTIKKQMMDILLKAENNEGKEMGDCDLIKWNKLNNLRDDNMNHHNNNYSAKATPEWHFYCPKCERSNLARINNFPQLPWYAIECPDCGCSYKVEPCNELIKIK